MSSSIAEMNDLHASTCAIEVMTPYITFYSIHMELMAGKLGWRETMEEQQIFTHITYK